MNIPSSTEQDSPSHDQASEKAPQEPSTDAWTAAQQEKHCLEPTPQQCLERQPLPRVVVFEEHRDDQDCPSWNLKEEARVRERLATAGIKWETSSNSRDCERLAADPESPGGFTIELGSVTTLKIRIAGEDAERAKEVLATPDGPSVR